MQGWTVGRGCIHSDLGWLHRQPYAEQPGQAAVLSVSAKLSCSHGFYERLGRSGREASQRGVEPASSRGRREEVAAVEQSLHMLRCMHTEIPSPRGGCTSRAPRKERVRRFPRRTPTRTPRLNGRTVAYQGLPLLQLVQLPLCLFQFTLFPSSIPSHAFDRFSRSC